MKEFGVVGIIMAILLFILIPLASSLLEPSHQQAVGTGAMGVGAVVAPYAPPVGVGLATGGAAANVVGEVRRDGSAKK